MLPSVLYDPQTGDLEICGLDPPNIVQSLETVDLPWPLSDPSCICE